MKHARGVDNRTQAGYYWSTMRVHRLRPVIGGVALLLLGGFVLTNCGDSACEAMMSLACNQCQDQLSPEWEAACLCSDDEDYVKAYGFHCKDTSDWDQDVCRITMDTWSDRSCDLLNRSLPFSDKLPDLSR